MLYIYDMIYVLQIYERVFERHFLVATDEMYKAEGQQLSVELEVPQYLAHVNQRLCEEHERVIHYLDNNTKYGSRKKMFIGI